MPGKLVDLTDAGFWAVAGMGFLVLVPLRSAALRRWAQAAINLALLKLLLSRWQLAAVVAALVVVWLLLQSISRTRYRTASAVLLCATGLLLFIRHKVAFGLDLPVQSGLAAVLASLGFSYVFLRLLDVTRCVAEDRSPAPSLPDTVNYLVPFHMLAAGPIQSYDEFVRAPADVAPLTISTALVATERLAWGLFKKFVLASAISHAFLTGFSVGGWYFLLEVQLFYVWLYLDFSALSDIALGLGGLLGLSTPQNFNRPYLARNVINFWERWHISLSQFIRRNLYLPIQMWLARRTDNSYPLACSSFAFVVSFGLCGMWHAVESSIPRVGAVACCRGNREQLVP